MNERLRTWLRFDADRVPEVEEAYRQFVYHSKPGIAFCIAFVLGVGTAIVVGVWLMSHGWTERRAIGPTFVTLGAIFYGILLFAIVRSPLPVLGRMLAGAVNAPRACLLALCLGAICVVIELVTLLALSAALSHAPRSRNVSLFSGGIAAGLLLGTVAAPFAEEFLMQGWLQTRLRRLGPFWAGAVTTVAFVLMHAPTSVFDLTRGVALGTAAWFRATTRSMLACIVVHAANNSLIAAVLLAGRASAHR